jgi:hypothetical protein
MRAVPNRRDSRALACGRCGIEGFRGSGRARFAAADFAMEAGVGAFDCCEFRGGWQACGSRGVG